MRSDNLLLEYMLIQAQVQVFSKFIPNGDIIDLNIIAEDRIEQYFELVKYRDELMQQLPFSLYCYLVQTEELNIISLL